MKYSSKATHDECQRSAHDPRACKCRRGRSRAESRWISAIGPAVLFLAFPGARSSAASAGWFRPKVCPCAGRPLGNHQTAMQCASERGRALFGHLVIKVLTHAVFRRQLVPIRILGGIRIPGGRARERSQIAVLLCRETACRLTIVCALHHFRPDQRALGHDALDTHERIEQ
jgi:hypothetical protein